MAINSIGGYNNISAYNQTMLRGPATGIAGISPPDYGPGKIPTKTTPTRSDDEIRQSIIEMAKKDAAQGVHGADLNGHGRKSKQWEALENEYVSSHSPDRIRLFAKRMNEISDGLKQNPFRTPHIDTSFMELMLTGEIKDKENTGNALERLIRKSNGDLGGNTITGQVKMIKFKEGGTDIGSWSIIYGWGYCPTEAERSRMAEMVSIYNQA